MVQALPHLWGREGDPEDQARARAAVVDPVEEAKNHCFARWTGVTIMEVKYRAKRSVKMDVDGELRKVKRGELLDGSELIVSLVPNAFERVSVERTPADSLTKSLEALEARLPRRLRELGA